MSIRVYSSFRRTKTSPHPRMDLTANQRMAVHLAKIVRHYLAGHRAISPQKLAQYVAFINQWYPYADNPIAQQPRLAAHTHPNRTIVNYDPLPIKLTSRGLVIQ